MKRKVFSVLFALVLLCSLSLVTAVPAGAQSDYHVATDGSDSFGDGTETWVDTDLNEVWSSGDTGPWLTIGYAITQVVNTDTINVAEGIYDESLSVTKEISIIGVGPTTIIDPAEDADGFTITADNVLIKDLKVSTQDTGGESNIAIRIDGTDSVEVNTVMIEAIGDGAMGIWMGGTASTNLSILDCIILIANKGTAIYGAKIDGPPHSNWTITGNTLSAANEPGCNLELYDVDTVLVDANTFLFTGSVNLVYSSEYSNVGSATISNNSFAGNLDGAWPDVIPTIWIESTFQLWDGSTAVDGVAITGNTFNNWKNSAILIGEPGGAGTFDLVSNVVINSNIFNMTTPYPAILDYTEAATGTGNTFNVSPTALIQDAVDSAFSGETINVATGDYAGAIVDKDVTVSGAEGGASVITSGVKYRAGNGAHYTAFRPDADGAEIRNFTINCDEVLDLGVYARGVDDVTVDSLTINSDGTVQGISNWGGSGWVITNNVITNTVTAGGGGIGIFLGAMPPTDYSESTELRVCTGNLIQLNKVTATATAETYSCAGIAVCLDTRYGGYANLDGSEDVSGNQILDNIITSSGVNNSVGIEIGAILGDSESDELRTDPDAIAAIMAAAAVHDNLVQDNSIDGAETGVYFYNVTDLTVTQNEIANSIVNGIYVEHGHCGVAVNYNNIYGNACGLENDDTDVDYGSIDATLNWWGDVAGPDTSTKTTLHNPYESQTGGNGVSDNVDYLPWLIQIELVEGWNIWSVPIAVDEACLPQLDAALTPEVVVKVAYYFDSSTQDWWNIPEDASPMDAWYIKMKTPVTVNIWASSEATFPWQKEMKVGWNLVGLAELYEMCVEDALYDAYYGTGETELVGYSKVLSPSLNGDDWSSYLRDYEISEMYHPTKGYWVFMVNDGVLGGFASTPIVEVEGGG